jgi:hypothetical protein
MEMVGKMNYVYGRRDIPDKFSVSGEYELLEFFGSEPYIEEIGDYVSYEVKHNSNILRFAFYYPDKVVSTELICNGIQTMYVCCQGNVNMKIDGNTLTCIFGDKCKITVLTVYLNWQGGEVKDMNVKWSTRELDG